MFYKIHKIFIQSEVLRYLSVGGFNTFLGYLFYAALIFIGMHYVFSVVISTVFNLIISFNTQGRLVFKNIQKKNKKSEQRQVFFMNLKFLKYILMGLSSIFFGSFIIKFFYEFLKFNYYFSGLFSTALLALINYFLCKYWIFKRDA